MKKHPLLLPAMVITTLVLTGGRSVGEERFKGDRRAETARVSAIKLLHLASGITLKQSPEQSYWADRVLLDIGKIQIRAKDFDGALHSIQKSSYDYGRESGIVELAAVLARHGDLDRATGLLQSIDEVHRWQTDHVTLKWIEYLIERRAWDEAATAIEQLLTETCRIDGLTKLAIASFKASHAERAASLFMEAFEIADRLEDEFARIRALSELGEVQSATGSFEAVRRIIGRLTEERQYDESGNRLQALRRAATLEFKIRNPDAARCLLRRALELRESVDEKNREWFLIGIGGQQADLGDFEGALETAALIEQRDPKPKDDRRASAVLRAVVVARLLRDQLDEAVRAVSTIPASSQYRDEALQEILRHQTRRGDIADALDTADRLGNESTRAEETLTIAALYARAGHRDRARENAARIELSPSNFLWNAGIEHSFDYRSPRTWGTCYEPAYSTMSSHRAREHAARVASAAMSLAHALGEAPAEPCEELFKEFRADEAIRALARTDTRLRNSEKPPSWVRRIGQDGRAEAKDDYETIFAVEQRIHALIGSAEGLLDIAEGSSAEVKP